MITEVDKADNVFEADTRVRCFNHVINLVARTLTHQFDNVVKKIRALNAIELKLNPDAIVEDIAGPEDEDEEPGEDEPVLPEEHPAMTTLGLEDWVDEIEDWSIEKLKAWANDTKPVRTVLCKVWLHTYISGSSTLID